MKAQPTKSKRPQVASPAQQRKRDRGVALIIAVVSIAILTAVATQFIYTSRVDLQMAANHRDDTRAYFMAKSGIGLSRLMLSFQKQVDNIQLPPGLNELLGGALGGGAQTDVPTPTGFNIKLWEMARIDCYMLQAMVPPTDEMEASERSKSESELRDEGFDDGEGGFLAAPQARDFGGFDGCFNVKIDPEEPKINLNGLDFGRGNVDQMIALLSDKRFEFLFDEEDSNGVKVAPTDLIIHMQDWADPDEVDSQLDLSGANPLPFTKGFGDEDSPYDRYDPEFGAKNARFDSLDELYMVHGVNDKFMAAFRDRFTVYTDPNLPPNINTEDPILLWRAILAVGDPIKDPRLRDPLFVATLIQRIQAQRMMSFLGTSSKDFIALLEASGVQLRREVQAAQNRGTFLSDKNNTFTITSTGEAGSVKKKITAVVRMDQGGMGRLVYWREE